MIKQTIQYRAVGLHTNGEWADVNEGGELLGGRYEFRIQVVYPIGYKFKSKWCGTTYEVIGGPVTARFGVEEATNYPIRATEEDGDMWYEFEREDVIAKAEEVK